jgi:transposase
LAASDDRQEGGALLAAALFAPVPSRSPIAQLVSHTAQTRRPRIQAAGTTTGRCLKMNKSGPTQERQELIELRRKLRQVQTERDILAKATAWFAGKSEKTFTPSTNS